MDETLTLVDAGQVSDEGSHIEATETVEPETGVSESAVPAEQQSEISTPKTAKPQQSAEENARYAAIRREAAAAAEAKARDAMIAEIYGDQGIKSYADYQKAKAEADRQAALDRLVQQNIPQEYAEKLMKVDELEAWKREQEAARQEETRRAADATDFFKAFREREGRDYNPEVDAALVAKIGEILVEMPGLSTRAAYEIQRGREADAKLRGVDKGKQTAAINAANATTATGSVTGNGTVENTVLTDEIIERMSDNERIARWPDIKKFYKMK